MEPIHFKYSKSQKWINWGYSFDSLTEVKFAIYVMDDYEILRGRVSIYYHPGTLQPTDYIRTCHRRYTPDFLIRHKQTGHAFLVEVKPRIYEREPHLCVMKTVAENYIQQKGYDWQYRVIFDDEIILNQEQLEVFEDCQRLRASSDRKLWFEELSRRYDLSARTLFTTAPRSSKVAFVMLGRRPEN
ncbi:TnsA endonuclease N-terminal domain-containing protein [Niabella ginsengisoli]|uniref:TnsA endonuclease N-terminal domain-containing protein n=1 Tax=Niabella ginsengisoli TaxID=522298 RepID=A0ABS9SHZ7_9BACT|nr:TnsA endonuclease N-terminal domain-containing protein [Niabella ginsengisoli]MCH5597989.1 hypothetical protein [Niabella ginsengisoli]